MKILITLFAFTLSGLTYSRTLEVEVHGMTCAFCVESLEKKFNQFDTVSKIEVSLKNNKIRLETNPTEPSFKVIKQTILDAGFTPITITVIDTE